MTPIFYASIVLLFAAIVLSIEGVYEWWNSRHGPAARRIESRIRAVSAGGQVQQGTLDDPEAAHVERVGNARQAADANASRPDDRPVDPAIRT